MLSTNFHNGDEDEEDENYEDDDDDVCIFITFVLRCISFESVFIFAHFGDKAMGMKRYGAGGLVKLGFGYSIVSLLAIVSSPEFVFVFLLA